MIFIRFKSTVSKYGWKDSLKLWYNHVSDPHADRAAHDKLFSMALPYYNREYEGIRASTLSTPLSKNMSISEVRVQNADSKNHVVMLHGYAASSGWWFKNIHSLARAGNKVVHALDLPGFGLSSRHGPSFPDNRTRLQVSFDDSKVQHMKHLHRSLYVPESFTLKERNLKRYLKNQHSVVERVVNFYVDALEEWRCNNGINQFDLVAHSLGGYLGVFYCIKYPTAVRRLVLASPGGVERSPFAITNPAYENIAGDFTMACSYSPADYSFLGRYPAIKPGFQALWHMRMPTFLPVRLLGPVAVRLLMSRNIEKFTRSKDFSDATELETFAKYVYHTNVAASVSETAIMRIFDSSIMAKIPILDRLKNLKPKSLWIYGQHDFMFSDAGRVAVNWLNKMQEGSAEFKVVHGGGHNMYLDNPAEFNRLVVDFLK
ncbi:hypothetical protein KL905_002888 [Ogataea polymorpha]|uniref:AB hydrolase-1 domain-containing protein n=1 Tax=Ogataea polymorpha TaxID=460523 RepID=A0A9P8SYT4_9ASCO|nr:hypothetical protein KL937_002446 [Ogataea polymorpha]KAG7893309.1 hypothetical protein KL908_003042 [Ogataea polymorpha]KAG7916523.1 hypothetical protein KL927_003162 [Ogataea polymorpha]KAG7921430.1 hypothetical protein KL905_002888 [Ogataea polymorpha]KAG7935271.1 hypothetical protein KL904_002964 [Ogataea polymorpha]